MFFPLHERDKTVGATSGALKTLTGITPNPGALTGQIYRPESLADAAPLVVVLHGCTSGEW